MNSKSGGGSSSVNEIKASAARRRACRRAAAASVVSYLNEAVLAGLVYRASPGDVKRLSTISVFAAKSALAAGMVAEGIFKGPAPMPAVNVRTVVPVAVSAPASSSRDATIGKTRGVEIDVGAVTTWAAGR